jgi:hypothetical protein
MISLNTKLSYLIPMEVDRERQIVTFYAHEVGKSFLPSFVNFTNETKEFIFSPTQIDIV